VWLYISSSKYYNNRRCIVTDNVNDGDTCDENPGISENSLSAYAEGYGKDLEKMIQEIRERRA
jgi:hypothetical protein